MTTIGIIGAGHIGSELARASIAAGYDVVIANSRGPETLADLITELGPHAAAGTAAQAAEAAEAFAVVTVPLHAYRNVPVAPLAGKIVIDTNNYYPQRDGVIAAIEEGRATVSGLLQDHLPQSRIVKAFNHLPAAAITAEAEPSGTADRRALAVYSDGDAAAATVAEFIDAIGFDAVLAGPLADSWRIERDRPGYGPRLTTDQLVAALDEAVR